MTLAEIRPTERHRVYDLVRNAGVDVTDWAKYKGGKSKAAANPKYCYEWSFIQPGKVVVLNLWHPELDETDGVIWRGLNLRHNAERVEVAAVRKRRARTMDQHIQTAYAEQLPIRVVLLDGRIRHPRDPDRRPSSARSRTLDPEKWAITAYDWATGECIVTRGARLAEPPETSIPDEELEAVEGVARRRLIFHRQREHKLRRRKIQEALSKDGKLVCQVPYCGFDFLDKYGELGKGFAHVHHLSPLSDAPNHGRRVTLNDLAIVCANCHAMIHRGGECRPLKTLIKPA